LSTQTTPGTRNNSASFSGGVSRITSMTIFLRPSNSIPLASSIKFSPLIQCKISTQKRFSNSEHELYIALSKIWMKFLFDMANNTVDKFHYTAVLINLDLTRCFRLLCMFRNALPPVMPGPQYSLRASLKLRTTPTWALRDCSGLLMKLLNQLLNLRQALRAVAMGAVRASATLKF
jgi:hypothetical protein